MFHRHVFTVAQNGKNMLTRKGFSRFPCFKWIPQGEGEGRGISHIVIYESTWKALKVTDDENVLMCVQEMRRL